MGFCGGDFTGRGCPAKGEGTCWTLYECGSCEEQEMISYVEERMCWGSLLALIDLCPPALPASSRHHILWFVFLATLPFKCVLCSPTIGSLHMLIFLPGPLNCYSSSPPPTLHPMFPMTHFYFFYSLSLSLTQRSISCFLSKLCTLSYRVSEGLICLLHTSYYNFKLFIN